MAEQVGEESKVLLVEDDPTLRRVMRMMLGTAGYGVAEAASGEEAVNGLEEGGLVGVVLDLGLSDSKSTEVLNWLHDHQEMPPWLVVSVMDRADAARLDRAIEGRFISKPFDPWMLLARIESMVGRPAKSAWSVERKGSA